MNQIVKTAPWVPLNGSDIFYYKNVPYDGNCFFSAFAYSANEALGNTHFTPLQIRLLAASQITESSYEDDLEIIKAEEPAASDILGKCRNYRDLRKVVCDPYLIWANHLIIFKTLHAFRNTFVDNFGLLIYYDNQHRYIKMPDNVDSFETLGMILYENSCHYQIMGFRDGARMRNVFAEEDVHLLTESLPCQACD